MSDEPKMESQAEQSTLADSPFVNGDSLDLKQAAVPSAEDSEIAKLRKSFEARLNECDVRAESLRAKEAELTSREQRLALSERQLAKKLAEDQAAADAEIAQKRQDAENEIFQKRQSAESEIAAKKSESIAVLEREMGELRSKRLQEVTDAEEAEHARVRSDIERERDAWEDEWTKREESLASEREELQKLRGVLSAQMDEINRKNAEFQDRERDLEAQEERMRARAQRRGERLDQEAAELVAEYKATIEAEKRAMSEENDNLRRSLLTQKGLLAAYQELETRLGGRTLRRFCLR